MPNVSLMDFEISKVESSLRPVAMEYWKLAVVLYNELTVPNEYKAQSLQLLLESRNAAIKAVERMKQET